MRRRTLILLAVPFAVLAGAAAFGFAAGNERKPVPDKPRPLAQRRALEQACASRRTYEGLKAQIFDEAAAIRGSDRARLDLLSGVTVVRMDDPLLRTSSEDLGVTVCSGRFVVELPPGAESHFGGRRRLDAQIEYAAQTAADGSGLIYRLRGAEPIVYRLAAFGALPVAAAAAAAPVPVPIGTMPDPVKAEEPEPPEAEEAPRAAPSERRVESGKPVVKPAEKAARRPAPKKAATAEPKKGAAKTEPKKAAAKPPVRKADAAGPTPARKAVATKPVAKKPAAKKPAAVKSPAPKPVPVQKAAVAKPKPAPARKAGPPPKLVKAAAPASPPRRAAPADPCAARPGLAERLVCGNAALAAKDRRATSLYISALDAADPETHAILRRTAANFRAYRDRCRTEACIALAYDDRMAEIRDIMADMR